MIPALLAVLAIWLVVAFLWWGTGVVKPMIRARHTGITSPASKTVLELTAFTFLAAVLFFPNGWAVLTGMIAPPLTLLGIALQGLRVLPAVWPAGLAFAAAFGLGMWLSRRAARPRLPVFALCLSGLIAAIIVGEIFTAAQMQRSANAQSNTCQRFGSFTGAIRRSLKTYKHKSHGVIIVGDEVRIWSYMNMDFIPVTMTWVDLSAADPCQQI